MSYTDNTKNPKNPNTTSTTTTTTNTNNNTNRNMNTTHGHSGAGVTSGTDDLVKTGNYSTGLERGGNGYPSNAVPIIGNTHQNRVSGVATVPGVAGGMMPGNVGSGDGLVVNNGLGGPLGGSVVMGGQCECTMNGGSCQHGAGKCVCRGCTTRATTINPGINVGVSTTQYTAPVGTTGIAGGVTDPGVGIAGVVNPVNSSGQWVNPADSNCACVKNGGTCNCPPGACNCENCTAKRSSMQYTSAAQGHHHHHHGHHAGTGMAMGTGMGMGTGSTQTSTTTNTTTNTRRMDQSGVSNIAPLGGSEYPNTRTNPDAAYKSSTTANPPVNTKGTTGPITDNSDVAYKKGDYMEGHPVVEKSEV